MKRRLDRSRHIAHVLTRNGLRVLAREAGLGRWLADDVDGADETERIKPVALAATLQELGTVYIKFGQALAMRRDLLPPEYCDALATLTDAVPAVGADEIVQVLTEDFDDDLAHLFDQFDRTPLGSASVGQVHAAVLADGRSAVVKVRKPGVAEVVEDDLALLDSLARALERNNTQLRELGLVAVVESFAGTLRDEIHFTTEAQVCSDMAGLFANDATVHVPWIERSLTTPRVVTQERITGMRLDDADALAAAGLDPTAVGRTYVNALMRMVFEFGRFHADPHAGNVFVRSDGTLVFIDWGMVGRLDGADREKLVRLMVAFASGQENLLLSALLDLAPPRRRLDRERLRRDIDHLLGLLTTKSLQELSASELTEELWGLVRRHHLNLSPAFSTLFRVLIISDGITRSLAPELSVLEIATQQAQRQLARHLRPDRVAEWLQDQLGDGVVFAHDLPARLRRILDRIESGELDINVRADVLATSVSHLDRIGRHLVLGMVSSAGIIATALVLLARRHQPDQA